MVTDRSNKMLRKFNNTANFYQRNNSHVLYVYMWNQREYNKYNQSGTTYLLIGSMRPLPSLPNPCPSLQPSFCSIWNPKELQTSLICLSNITYWQKDTYIF